MLCLGMLLANLAMFLWNENDEVKVKRPTGSVPIHQTFCCQR